MQFVELPDKTDLIVNKDTFIDVDKFREVYPTIQDYFLDGLRTLYLAADIKNNIYLLMSTKYIGHEKKIERCHYTYAYKLNKKDLVQLLLTCSKSNEENRFYGI